MAEGIKKYQIVINGLTESISQVESLNNTLKTLEERINALSSKKINVAASTSTGGGSKSSSKGSLSEEEKIAQQIEKIDAKRVAYSKQIYQNEKTYKLFGDCLEKNLQSYWGKEQLYVQGISEPDFIMVLEKNLRMHYEAAKRQGFEIWIRS